MAIQVLVDGYNLIGSDMGLRGDLQRKRDELIQTLHNYQESKSYLVTIVFDGWRSGWVYEVEETIRGVTVVYSRQGEKADAVIIRLARQMGNGCVVVSSDREVRRAVERAGAVAIYAGEFNAILKNFGGNCDGDETESCGAMSVKKGNPRKLSKSERKRRDRLKKLKT
jgi:uncharacterized protein